MLHPEQRRESIRQIAYEEGFHDGYAQALSEMPEIIRCKDCKYYTGGIDGYCDRWFRRTGGNMSFCNEAERIVR